MYRKLIEISLWIIFEMACVNTIEELSNACQTTNAEGTKADELCAMTIHPDQVSPMVDDLPLSSEVDECHKSNLAAAQKLSQPYKGLVAKYPKILEANFKKEPATDIYHRIETTGEPFKSKMRPLLASSEKSKQGKKTWEEMESLGGVERVKPNALLQYTSPVHLVKKPSGDGWRVCADFRLLNACLLYTSPSPRDQRGSRMPSSA
mgnify:CR=1 FL=1